MSLYLLNFRLILNFSLQEIQRIFRWCMLINQKLTLLNKCYTEDIQGLQCGTTIDVTFDYWLQEIVLPTTTVVERGLVTEKAKWKEIVNNHQLYSSAHTGVSHFTTGPVLGYVTPVCCYYCLLCVVQNTVWDGMAGKFGGENVWGSQCLM